MDSTSQSESPLPKVSVMVPCYNTGEAVRRTLDSVVNQTFDDWEVVAVDDLSKDNTGAILEEYAQKYPGKVRVIHNVYENGVKHNSFNVGWRHCRGAWVIDLGHDDLLSPGFLADCLERARKTGADAIVPRVVLFSDDSQMPAPPGGGLKGDLDAVISGREAVMLSLDWQITSFCLWRGEIARSSRIDEEDTPFDWGELESRRRFMQCRMVAFSTGEYRYRFNPTSITHSKWGRNSHRRLVTNREILSDLIKAHFPDQIIDSYRFQTYRLFCGSCSRFAISRFRFKDRRGATEVRRELLAFYRDPILLDKSRLRCLCPNLLDVIRLKWFWTVVPISFWRKLLNRVLHCEQIF